MMAVQSHANQTSLTHKQAVQIQGHLIDSLTLAKVIDLVQSQGGDYHLNHLAIGHLKNELSTVMLTIEAESAEKLNTILESLTPYGVKKAHLNSVQTATCQQAGVAPKGALLQSGLPAQLFWNDQWLKVDNSAGHLVVVLDSANQTARLVPQSQLKTGDVVVLGSDAIAWEAPSQTVS